MPYPRWLGRFERLVAVRVSSRSAVHFCHVRLSPKYLSERECLHHSPVCASFHRHISRIRRNLRRVFIKVSLVFSQRAPKRVSFFLAQRCSSQGCLNQKVLHVVSQICLAMRMRALSAVLHPAKSLFL